MHAASPVRDGEWVVPFSELLAPAQTVLSRPQTQFEMPALPLQRIAGPAFGQVGGEIVGERVGEVGDLRVALGVVTVRGGLERHGNRRLHHLGDRVEILALPVPPAECPLCETVEVQPLPQSVHSINELDHRAGTEPLHAGAQLVPMDLGEFLARVFLVGHFLAPLRGWGSR